MVEASHIQLEEERGDISDDGENNNRSIWKEFPIQRGIPYHPKARASHQTRSRKRMHGESLQTQQDVWTISPYAITTGKKLRAKAQSVSGKQE